MNQPLTWAQSLRADFDLRFSEAPPAILEEGEGLLAVRAGGDPYALRMADIASLSAGAWVTRLPGGDSAFLGLSARRKEVLPVWDLGRLLGYAPAPTPPRWLARSKAAPHWALAFESLDGCLRPPRQSLCAFAGGGQAEGLATHLCTMGGLLRPVLIFEKLLQSTRQGRPDERA